MRKTFSFFIILFSINFTNVVSSNDNIYYVDMDFIMNNSLAGKSLSKQLEKKTKSYLDQFKKTETSLKEEENKLIAQKNITDKKDFESRKKPY